MLQLRPRPVLAWRHGFPGIGLINAGIGYADHAYTTGLGFSAVGANNVGGMELLWWRGFLQSAKSH